DGRPALTSISAKAYINTNDETTSSVPEIVATDASDDPPKSKVFDAALTHLTESEENLQDVRVKYSPQMVKDCCNTQVLGLRYRTSVESRWRR
ncbi:hypothetical protein C499_01395, partial [Halogeometricum borinquense DSM 11551]